MDLYKKVFNIFVNTFDIEWSMQEFVPIKYQTQCQRMEWDGNVEMETSIGNAFNYSQKRIRSGEFIEETLRTYVENCSIL